MLAAARILGSGGYLPTDARETSCLLLRGPDGGAVVVDAGTGLRRLVTDPRLLDGADSVDLLLTHFHADHVIGLTWLADVPVPVRVWGPGQALHGRPTEAVLEPFLSAPVFDGGLGAVAASVGELEVGDQRIGELDVRTRIQEGHPGRSLGLRFGDDLVWCTDTEADQGTAQFARDAHTLGHDAWDIAPAEGHTTAAEAGLLAAEAGVDRLVLIHVPPTVPHDALLAEASLHHGDVCLARDGLSLL
jgi:ribonuclease BN (tRNA processing enzyme)